MARGKSQGETFPYSKEDRGPDILSAGGHTLESVELELGHAFVVAKQATSSKIAQ